MTAFIASFTLVLLAEMGDKTQLLAMAFAAKYKAYKVLIAVFLATLLINSGAVLVGKFLTAVVPIRIVSIAASISFIIFGLLMLRPEKLHGGMKSDPRFGPIVTVGVAFFLAEMGDKTQLATISLAVKYQDMFGVLMGSTLAMVTANAIGIALGSVIRRYLPENVIKWISALVFIAFGVTGICGALLNKAF